MEIRSSRAAVLDRPTSDAGPLVELTGRAVPYDVATNIGYYFETFVRGAFRDSLASTRNVPLLTFHDDKSFPIGVATAWDDRADGLHGTWRLGRSAAAQEAARLVQDGMLNFLSIRFMPDAAADRWTIKDGNEFVTRTRARLVEVSLVSTPAYADATVTGVRSASPSPAGVLADELDAPLLVPAIQGSNEDQAAAVGIVRCFLDQYGSRAPVELATMAPDVVSSTILGLNLARAAAALEDTDSATLRARQLEAWNRFLGKNRRGDALPPRRRRR